MQIELSTIVKQSKDQVSCCLNDEVAILSLSSTLYFGLDEVGACIWQAMSEARSVEELGHIVLNSFEVDETQCYADILEFLAKLDQAELIEQVTDR